MDFNDLFILECFAYKEDRDYLKMYTIPSMKDFNLSTRFQTLKKRELIVEDPNNSAEMILSLKGQDVLDQILHPEPLTSAKVVIMDMSDKTDDEKFEEWWKHYPTSPAWKTEDGNTVFAGSRTLKNLRKAEAKKRYLKLLNQGLKHDELLGSLLFEIKLKKLDSVKKNQNQMEYFKGMESYFNQERYLLFIDSYRDNPTWVNKITSIKGKKQNVIDI